MGIAFQDLFNDMMAGGTSGIPGAKGPFGEGGFASGKSSGGGMPAMIPGLVPIPQSLLSMLMGDDDKDKGQG